MRDTEKQLCAVEPSVENAESLLGADAVTTLRLRSKACQNLNAVKVMLTIQKSLAFSRGFLERSSHVQPCNLQFVRQNYLDRLWPTHRISLGWSTRGTSLQMPTRSFGLASVSLIRFINGWPGLVASHLPFSASPKLFRLTLDSKFIFFREELTGHPTTFGQK